eukprot:6921629-Pyramimonas_sp.AAC.1
MASMPYQSLEGRSRTYAGVAGLRKADHGMACLSRPSRAYQSLAWFRRAWQSFAGQIATLQGVNRAPQRDLAAGLSRA